MLFSGNIFAKLNRLILCLFILLSHLYVQCRTQIFKKNSKGIVFIELSSMELDQNVSSLATLAAHSVGQIRSYALLNSELYI